MITPIKTMTINQIVERKDDLLMSDDDIKELARNVRNKAIDDFISRLEKHTQENWIDHQEYGITWADIEQIAEQLKGVQNNENML